jgi:hypothetical protein
LADDVPGIPSQAMMNLSSFDKHDAPSIGMPHPKQL